MLSSYQEQGYILHRSPFRERSVIVDFFGFEAGRQRFILHTTKANKGLLQPFLLLSLSVRGKGELKNGSQLEALGNAENLHGHYLYSAFYVNELMRYLLEAYEPAPDLYTLYQNTLKNLGLQADLEGTLRGFEHELLSLLGYGIDFEWDVDGRPVAVENHYRFVNELGFQAIDRKLAGFSGADLIAIGNNELESPTTKLAAKRIFRQVINTLLDGRELKSRRLFAKPQ